MNEQDQDRDDYEEAPYVGQIVPPPTPCQRRDAREAGHQLHGPGPVGCRGTQALEVEGHVMRAVNRETFIERLKQGPAQFLEFAGTRSANASQRKDAIKVRDELLADGVIRLVYIGHYPYLILASKEAEDQALRQYLEENIRIDRETGCKVWQGVFDGRGRPIMRMSLISNRVINVRRYFWELERHDKLSVTDVVTMRGTCEDGCINSEHMVKERRSQNMRGKPKSLTQRIRMSKAVAELRGKAAQYVELIRTSDKTCKELAIETGMSASNVSLIRRGQTFRFQNGVFTGLIAANHGRQAA